MASSLMLEANLKESVATPGSPPIETDEAFFELVIRGGRAAGLGRLSQTSADLCL